MAGIQPALIAGGEPTSIWPAIRVLAQTCSVSSAAVRIDESFAAEADGESV